MQSLFRRTPSLPPASCFYCSTVLEPQPPDPRNFTCSSCSCRNRYDARGRIIGDEAAMHEEELNRQSYVLRASPSKTVFPTASSQSNLFCHTCRTNQTLQMNLLANYLPPSSDPTYQQLLDSLPQYKDSLNLRYPPICASCAPAVQEDIERKNQMARTTAFGGWLRRSREQSAEQRRRVSEESKLGFIQKLKSRWTVRTWPNVKWAVQGLLWTATLFASLLLNLNASGLVSEHHAPFRIRSPWSLLVFAFASRLWVDWDLRSHPQHSSGRTIVETPTNRRQWKDYQRNLWLLRLLNASYLVWASGTPNRVAAAGFLSIEILLLVLSIWSLRPSGDVRLRPIPINTRSTRPAPTGIASASFNFIPPEMDPLASLSLSSLPLRSSSLPPTTTKPQAIPRNEPIFGQTSLSSNAYVQNLFGPTSSAQEDEMDWDPLPGRTLAEELRPQTFFPREEPTGLESLFENWNWLDDSSSSPSKGKLKSKEEAMLPQAGLSQRMLSWVGLRRQGSL